MVLLLALCTLFLYALLIKPRGLVRIVCVFWAVAAFLFLETKYKFFASISVDCYMKLTFFHTKVKIVN